MKTVFSVFLVLGIPALCICSTIHVPGDHSTIQGAIDAAVAGDTVLVAAGTYVENIDFKGKAITVTSEDGPKSTVIDGSIPSNPDYGSVATFINSEGAKSILDGFTLMKGTGTLNPSWNRMGGGIYCVEASPTIRNNIITMNSAVCGGGIQCYTNSSPMIENNIISNNSGTTTGGAINLADNSNPTIIYNMITENSSGFGGGIICGSCLSTTITHNIIKNNNSDYGGGIDCYKDASPTIQYNIICGNSATQFDGGGIRVALDSSPSIINNKIFENTTPANGGGISVSPNSSSVIHGNAIFKNTAKNGGGIEFDSRETLSMIGNTFYGNSASNKGGAMRLLNSTLDMANNILWKNSASSGPEIYIKSTATPAVLNLAYSDLCGGKASIYVETGCTLIWGANMIDADPLFVDELIGDLHLKYPSPCKDTGDNGAVPPELTEDLEGDTRICYGNVDMGSDEFYTHLYYTGDATPGSAVEVKLVGLPGMAPVGLCLSMGMLDPPLSSMWGDWYLMFPIAGPIDLGAMPADGVMIINGFIPGTPPASYKVYMQAIIGAELSNLCKMKVE